jgi:hypothetical protein
MKLRNVRWGGGLESIREREDNFKMDLRDVGWGDIDWIDQAQGRDR